MNRKEENKYKGLVNTKVGGPIYRLYYSGKSYRCINNEVLYSTREVLEKIGIDYDDLNVETKAWVRQRINNVFYFFRKYALERGQYWGTIDQQLPSGKVVHMRGYTDDPAKLNRMKEYRHKLAVAIYQREKKENKILKSLEYYEPSKQKELA